MQLYALHGNLMIEASEAIEGQLYTCQECHGNVMRRRGRNRRFHFYHLPKPLSCHQKGKSLAHLSLQLKLKSIISELELEKRIGSRIADCCWEKEKIVFEIQCSRLSLKEVLLRCQDYLKGGYKLIWILHDRVFNKRKLSSAEAYLRQHLPTFFTDGGQWYDQFEVCGGGRRWFKGPKLIVDLDYPIKITALDQSFTASFRDWPFCFRGDFLHFLTTHPPSEIDYFKKITRTLIRKYKRRRWIETYREWLYKLLDQITR